MGLNMFSEKEMVMPKKVTLYALSTCGWCKKTKRFLEEHAVDYQCHDMDLLPGEEKDRLVEEVSRYNPRRSYPTVVIDGKEVVVGYDEDRLRAVLDL
jgi:glutaredoxin